MSATSYTFSGKLATNIFYANFTSNILFMVYGIFKHNLFVRQGFTPHDLHGTDQTLKVRSSKLSNDGIREQQQERFVRFSSIRLFV